MVFSNNLSFMKTSYTSEGGNIAVTRISTTIIPFQNLHSVEIPRTLWSCHPTPLIWKDTSCLIQGSAVPVTAEHWCLGRRGKGRWKHNQQATGSTSPPWKTFFISFCGKKKSLPFAEKPALKGLPGMSCREWIWKKSKSSFLPVTDIRIVYHCCALRHPKYW